MKSGSKNILAEGMAYVQWTKMEERLEEGHCDYSEQGKR